MILARLSKQNPLRAIELRVLHTLTMHCRKLEEQSKGVDGEGAPEVHASASNRIVDRARVSPEAFRAVIEVEPGRNYEKSLEPWQRQAFEAMDPAWMYAVGATDKKPEKINFYRELPRGHSKTTDTAAEILWGMLAAPNLIRGYVVAADEDQAKLTIEAAQRLVSFNRWIEDEIAITASAIRSTITGAECQILPANAGGVYGKSPAFIVCDELTVWKDKRVFDAMFSALPKVERCIMVINSNAGYGKGVSWQWKRREMCRTSRFWWFQSMDGPQASWQTKEKIDQQREELDPQEFQRLWMNKWLSGSATGIPYDHVVRATVLPGERVNRDNGCDFVVGGLDLGISHDRPALVWIGGNLQSRKLKLLGHRTWWPKDYATGQVNLMDVRRAILSDIGRFGGVNRLYADSWESALLRDSIASQVDCELVRFSDTRVIREMADRLVQSFANQDLHLFYDEDLERDLQAIEVRFNDRTRTKMLHAERNEMGHADSAFALAIANMYGMLWLEELTGISGSVGETQFEEFGT